MSNDERAEGELDFISQCDTDEMSSLGTFNETNKRIVNFSSTPIGGSDDGVASVQGELDKIKRTKLGIFYINFLKKNKLLRYLVIFIWPYYIRFVFFVIKKRKYKAHPLVKLSDHIQEQKIKSVRLCTAEVITTPQPKVYPQEKSVLLTSPDESYIFPSAFIVKLDSCYISGGSNLIRTESKTIHHDLFDVSRDATSEELHGRIFINAKKRRVTWLQPMRVAGHLPLAASFVDACAPNYAHWLTEVLPRIALFCANDKFNDVPLIVNAGLHENIMQSLSLIAGNNRDVYTLALGDTLSVSTLYVTSVAGYVPFGRRNTRLKDHSHGKFSRFSFELVNKFIADNCKKNIECSVNKKIYIKRNASIRNVINDTELESALIGDGFSIIEPEKYTFIEQFNLFRNADVIVASSGAALANLIFCRPNTNIVILISEHKDTSYWYWQNMACASGNVIRYVFGKITSLEKSIHSDFLLKIENVFDAIENN